MDGRQSAALPTLRGFQPADREHAYLYSYIYRVYIKRFEQIGKGWDEGGER